MTFKPDYPFEGTPELGTTLEVAPGIHWLRMPLPFKLDHINLWLLEDGDKWVIIDTGICRDEVKSAWAEIFTSVMQDRPVSKVVVTHFHPDHAGLAGWLTEKFDVPLIMPLAEWTFGRMVWLDGGEYSLDLFRAFYRRAGFSEEMMESVSRRVSGYRNVVAPIPGAFDRITDGDEITIGGKSWQMIVGRGHSPEHACLYCKESDVLISGDQVLPRISPNVSVWPQEPNGKPLGLYLETLSRIGTQISGNPLVLPSHDWPFYGLHARLDDLIAHHHERLDETFDAVDTPKSGVEVLRKLFNRPLDEHQTFFAIGETLAHLYHLADEGRIKCTRNSDGIDIYERA